MVKFKLIVGVLFFLIMSITFGIVIIDDISISNKEPQYLHEMSIDAFTDNERVEGEINAVVDQFCYEETEKNGSTHISKGLYTFPIGNDSLYIALEALPEDFTELDKMVELTHKYIIEGIDFDDTYLVDGRLREMNKEEHKYLLEYLSEFFGENEETVATYIIPYTIELEKNEKTSIVFLILGAACIIMLITSIIGLVNNIKQQQINKPKLHKGHDHGEMYNEFAASSTMCDDEKPPLGFE